MSENGVRSAAEWARHVGKDDPHSFADIERAVLSSKSESERSVGLGLPDSRTSRVGWLSVVLGILILAVPVVGVVQYWSGSYGARYGGNVDVDFSPDRAALIVPICFGFLFLLLVWNAFDWVRQGRPRLRRFLLPAVYFGACAGLALVFASNLGVSTTPGVDLEATAMWLCVGTSILAVLAFVLLSRETQQSSDLKVRDKLRIERRDVGNLLVGRGLMTESELQTLISKPFGSFIRDESHDA